MNRATQLSVSGNYRIEVQGALRPGRSDRFGAMRIASPPTKTALMVTVLQGHVSDQAELAGILNTLRVSYSRLAQYDRTCPAPLT